MSAVYPRKTTLETRGARKSRCTPSILGLRRGQQQSRLREIIPRRRGRTAGTVGTQGASVETDRSRSSKAVREQTGCRVSGSPVEKWSRRTQRPRGETVVRRHARCVPANSSIRVRDQDKGPAAPDVQLVLRQLASKLGRKFGFKVDVKDAHRLIPTSPEDWHLLACRSERGKHVYVNMTGTFGVASAAYWWGRVATAAIRGAHFVLGLKLPAWLLPVADDLAMLLHNGKMRESVLLVLVHLRVMGFPLSWKKLAGRSLAVVVGTSCSWGESITWAQQLACAVARSVRHSPAPGPLSADAGNSKWDSAGQRSCAARWTSIRPFLAPLCAFAARHAPVSREIAPALRARDTGAPQAENPAAKARREKEQLPKNSEEVLVHLEHRAAEPCAPSVLRRLRAALAFNEEAAGRTTTERVSKCPLALQTSERAGRNARWQQPRSSQTNSLCLPRGSGADSDLHVKASGPQVLCILAVPGSLDGTEICTPPGVITCGLHSHERCLPWNTLDQNHREGQESSITCAPRESKLLVLGS